MIITGTTPGRPELATPEQATTPGALALAWVTDKGVANMITTKSQLLHISIYCTRLPFHRQGPPRCSAHHTQAPGAQMRFRRCDCDRGVYPVTSPLGKLLYREFQCGWLIYSIEPLYITQQTCLYSILAHTVPPATGNFFTHTKRAWAKALSRAKASSEKA